MEQYIQISKINDFLFSPKSLYLHSIYESFDKDVYQESAQKIGIINHENIEKGKYSTSNRFLQALPIYSEKYNIGGKIDIYDKLKRELIERKTKIKKIYDGYRFQLYAQMFCLEEIGYPVEKLFIHSLSDNKRYQISLPNDLYIKEFEKILDDIRDYYPDKMVSRDYNCSFSIYKHLSY